MNDTSGITPNNNPTPPQEPSFNTEPTSYKNQNVPQSFAQKYWHFNDAEAKKFLTTLANTIASQIQHEQQQIQAESDKLKEAETEGDIE